MEMKGLSRGGNLFRETKMQYKKDRRYELENMEVQYGAIRLNEKDLI